MIAISLAFACDAGALSKAASEITVKNAVQTLAAACRTPVALHAALKKPDDPWIELQLALSRDWVRTCPNSLDALPDGFNKPDPHHRLRLHIACEFDSALATEVEFMTAPGPALTAIAFAAAARGVELPARRKLVRALLGIGEAPPPSLSPARQSKAAEVAWPWNAKRKKARCSVDATVFNDGRLGTLFWVECADEWQPYIRLALEHSIFEPATQHGLPVGSVVRLSFTP